MTGLQRDLLRAGVLPCAIAALLLALFVGVAFDSRWLGLGAAGIVVLTAWGSHRWLARRVVQPLRDMAEATAPAPATAGTHAHELARLRDGIAALQRQLREERGEADRRVRTSVSEALQRWSEAQAAHHGKTQFLAAVGDRLRQPVYAISLFIGALQRDATPEQRAAIDRLQGIADGMGALLDELLEIARLDAHVVEVAPQTLELRALFAAQAPRLAERAQAHGVALHWRDGGLWLHGDEQLLGRVLHHLIGNAIEHAPHGCVLVAARRCGDRVRLQVRDNGDGIARLHLARIFDEFFQLDDGRHERRLGLGLPICARIAALLGSRIEVRSALGRGSVFSLELPRVDAEAVAATTAASTAGARGA